jgi:hypothetical protein
MDLKPRKHGQRFRGLIKAYKRIMSFSLSARKLVVCWCSLVAIPVMVFSQNSFVPTGGEYSITGKLPGDQVHPQVSFTTNGGYVVWEDYWSDSKGLGVGAMRLKNDLSSAGNAFRVNSVALHDQEAGHVSVLNNGGAVFGWQGGPQGRQHIYARFLSSSNTWITGDTLVSASTNKFQSSPVIATLLNGNVAITYVSVNQAGAGSMMDVYLQMFTPDGNKIGDEVLVNEFTANNQRTPAIAALANGKLLIGWVSEQQRWTDASNGVPSVDILARIFDSSGAAQGSEFLVNVSSNVCAAPDFVGSADGGFMVTWMEKDLVVRNNGWDISARRFTSAGVGGNVTRLNTQLYGDQFSPKVRASGSLYLAVWDSLQQDGSQDGVFGRYLNDDATVSGGEFQVNSTTFGKQMHHALGSDGAGRFLTAWSTFGVGLAGFDLNGQKYIDPTVAVLGTNDTAFNSDPNANPHSVSNSPIISPVILPNNGEGQNSDPGSPTLSFSEVKGTYNGLVYDGSGVTSANSGYITITTTATKTGQGSFSAKLEMGGRKYSFSGQFDTSGAYSGTVSGMTVHLLIDLHGGDRITGDISNGDWTATLQANRVAFGKGHYTNLAGSYTMVIQPTDGTMGNGIGTVKVDASGNVKWNLILPDGTKLSESTTLSKSGAWPLYTTPYKSGGVTIGWMQFGSKAADGFDGQCVWTKPAGASAVYSGGLTNGVNVSGSLYKAPPASRTFGNSKVVLSGGGLSSPITNTATWGMDNKVISGSSLKLNVNPSSGLFQGTVSVSPGKGGTVQFQGVLFQKDNVGLGFFLGSDQSGAVNFAPNH